MVMEKLSQMDGRQRGQYLRNTQGQFTTRQEWLDKINAEIDECLKRKQHYQKFVGENPDLKVLMDYEQSKINVKRQEMNLVNFSRRGIKDRTKIYEEALKKQGMTGEQLNEQVARYREGLLQERRNYFDKLKGKNNAKNMPEKAAKPGFFKRIWNAIKGNKGKVGTAAAAIAAITTAAVVLKNCDSSSSIPVSGVVPTDTVSHDTIPITVPIKEEPEVKEPVIDDKSDTKQAETEPAQEGDYKKYIVGNNESIEKIAKQTGVSQQEIIELNKERLHNFYTNRNNCDNKNKAAGFLVGQEIILPSNAKIDKLKDAKAEQQKYNKAIHRVLDDSCPEKRNAFVA